MLTLIVPFINGDSSPHPLTDLLPFNRGTVEISFFAVSDSGNLGRGKCEGRSRGNEVVEVHLAVEDWGSRE